MQMTPVDLTSRYINELEGLQMFYTTQEQAFHELPPWNVGIDITQIQDISFDNELGLAVVG